MGLLKLAGHHGVEAVLAERLDMLLEAGELPDVKQFRDEFAPRQTLCPEMVVQIPPSQSMTNYSIGLLHERPRS